MMLQIKKFKDALAKHTPDRCSLGPTKGLEEKELVALAANRDLSFTYKPKPVPALEEGAAVPEPAPSHWNSDTPLPLPLAGLNSDTPLPLPLAGLESAQQSKEKKTLVNSGR